MRAQLLPILACAGLVDALAPRAAVSRRAAVLSAASAVPWMLTGKPAWAETPEQEAIIERAKQQQLNTERVLKRAKEGKFFDATGVPCEIIDSVLSVDELALERQLLGIKRLTASVEKASDADKASLAAELKEAEIVKGRLQSQINKLKQAETKKKCLVGKVTFDRACARHRTVIFAARAVGPNLPCTYVSLMKAVLFQGIFQHRRAANEALVGEESAAACGAQGGDGATECDD